MDSYTPEAYVSKIRRFGGFIAFTMIAFAFLEVNGTLTFIIDIKS